VQSIINEYGFQFINGVLGGNQSLKQLYKLTKAIFQLLFVLVLLFGILAPCRCALLCWCTCVSGAAVLVSGDRIKIFCLGYNTSWLPPVLSTPFRNASQDFNNLQPICLLYLSLDLYTNIYLAVNGKHLHCCKLLIYCNTL